MSDDLTLSTLSILNRLAKNSDVIGTGVFCHPTSEGTIRFTVFPIYSGEFFTHLKSLYHLTHGEEAVPLELRLIMADPATVLHAAHNKAEETNDTTIEVYGTRLTTDNLQKTHDAVIRATETMREAAETQHTPGP